MLLTLKLKFASFLWERAYKGFCNYSSAKHDDGERGVKDYCMRTPNLA